MIYYITFFEFLVEFFDGFRGLFGAGSRALRFFNGGFFGGFGGFFGSFASARIFGGFA